MKKIIVFLITLAILSVSLFKNLSAYNKSDFNKAYMFLKKKWYYYNYNGKKIAVNRLSWESRGSDYNIFVNGKRLDITEIYDKSGRNILNPSKRNIAPAKIAVGNERGVLKGITEAHNKYRRKTGGGLPELIWDENIAAYAQKWADYLKAAFSCRLKHRSGSYRKRSYGENLAMAEGRELESEDVVKMWYDEIKYYNYSLNTCSGVCGHYTQVVWRNSERIGCGYAKCKNSEVWVCNYDPPGNWVGEKPY